MKAIRRWWVGRSAGARWVLGACVFIVVVTAWSTAVRFIVDHVPLWALVPIFGPILVFVVIDAKRREKRDFGGGQQRRMFVRAARTGEIPSGADLDAWPLPAQREAAYYRDGRRPVGIAALVIGTLTTIALMASTIVRQSDWLLPLSATAMLVVFLVGVHRYWLVQEKRFTRLNAALDERAGSETP